MNYSAFILNIQSIDAKESDDTGIQKFLNILFAPGSSNHWKLVYELQREFKQGGSPEITGIAFDRVNYNPANGNGNFRVVLDINFTFGCEDMVTEKKDQTSEWTFTIDLQHKTISFYSSPYVEGRSTVDEF